MTEQNSVLAPNAPAPVPNPAEVAHVDPAADWVLRRLVSTINDIKSVDVALTLNVGGMLVSGHLCAASKYFEGIEAGFVAAGTPEAGVAFAASVKKMQEWVYSQNSTSVAYIHLRDAKFFPTTAAAPLPSKRGVWWRGRLSAVAGFSFGLLSAE